MTCEDFVKRSATDKTNTREEKEKETLLMKLRRRRCRDEREGVAVTQPPTIHRRLILHDALHQCPQLPESLWFAATVNIHRR